MSEQDPQPAALTLTWADLMTALEYASQHIHRYPVDQLGGYTRECVERVDTMRDTISALAPKGRYSEVCCEIPAA